MMEYEVNKNESKGTDKETSDSGWGYLAIDHLFSMYSP